MATLFKRITRSELVYRRLKANDQKAVYAGLLWIVKTKGFKPGWAAYKFKELFGDWPHLGFVEPQQPPSDLLTWIERQRRNYGARMKRKEAKGGKQETVLR